MDSEQMRWLGHVCGMTPFCKNAYAKTFARGAIDVCNFQRLALLDGGHTSADRRSLPDAWITLYHKHGDEATVEDIARDRIATTCWSVVLRKQSLLIARSPTSTKTPYLTLDYNHERRLELQRQRRRAAKAQTRPRRGMVGHQLDGWMDVM